MELNKVMVVGRLCADPNFRTTGSGTSVCDIRLAVDSGYGERKETVYLDVTAWSKTADFARQYLTKGQKVYAEGRLKQDEWQDKETGSKRTKIGVVADRIQFAEPKRESGSEPNSHRSETRSTITVEARPVTDSSGEDLPF